MYLLCINKHACTFQPEMAISYVHHQAEFYIVIIKDGLTQESEEKRHMFNLQERKRKGASVSSEHIRISYHIFVCSMNYDFCYTFEKYLNLHSIFFSLQLWSDQCDFILLH